jgi:YVTN family beta-propeller protein
VVLAALLVAAVVGLARCGEDTAPPVEETETLLYVANTGDATLSVIDTASHAVVDTIELDAPASALRLHPFRNSFYLAQPAVGPSAVGQVIKLLQLNSDVLARIALPGRNPVGLIFSRDTSLAFVGVQDSNLVAVLRLAEDRVLTSVAVGRGPVALALENTLPGRVFVLNELDASVSVINLSNLRVGSTVSLGAGTRPRSLALRTSASLAYVADAASGSLLALKLDTLELDPNSVIPDVGVPNDVVVRPGTGTLLVTNGRDNTLLLIDAAAPETRSTLATGPGPTEILVNSAGTRAYVANTGGNSVTVVNLETTQVLATVTVGAAPRGLALF